MLTGPQLLDFLQEILHQDTTFDSTDLYNFLSLGQRRIVHDAPWVLGAKSTTFNTVDGTQEYSLAADFYQMRSMWNTTTPCRIRPVRPSDWTDAVENETALVEGVPRWYYIRGWDVTAGTWNVRLHYVPDGVYAVNYLYYWLPADVSATKNGPIAAAGFDELVLWAGAMIATQRNDPQGHVTAFNNYQRLLQEYKAHSAEGPDYIPCLRGEDMTRGGSTLTLPDEFPAN